MDYQQFVDVVKKKVSVGIGDHVTVTVCESIKNNSRKRIGVTIGDGKLHVSPTIYLEEYYTQYQRGKSPDDIASEIRKLYEKMEVTSFDSSLVDHYEGVRERILYKVIHRERNAELLENIPYLNFLDLAVVFYVMVAENARGSVTMLIYNHHLERWQVDPHQMYEDSQKNTERLLPPEFKTMNDAIVELLDIETKEHNEEYQQQEDHMYILTNCSKSFGAATILYSGLLEKVGKELKEDYYVLPSSIHEVIIIPESRSPEKADLNEMVSDMNRTQVEPEEVLSDQVYYYNRKVKKLTL